MLRSDKDNIVSYNANIQIRHDDFVVKTILVGKISIVGEYLYLLALVKELWSYIFLFSNKCERVILSRVCLFGSWLDKMSSSLKRKPDNIREAIKNNG